MNRTDMPPFPPITSLMEELPDQTDSVFISLSNQQRLLMYAMSLHYSKIQGWVSDTINHMNDVNPGVILRSWGDGCEPTTYNLQLRAYWQQVPNTYTHVNPGGGFSKTYTSSHGITTTDSQTISAELGLEGGGLSAKITATFGHTVETSQQTSEQTEYTVGAPDNGFVRVWVLWQLVHEIVAWDDGGLLIPSSVGSAGTGDVFFTNPPGGGAARYLRLQFLFP